MARQKLIRTSTGIYHVTSRANNKDWFSLPMEEMWSIYGQLLHQTIERYGIHLHAFVLMANHFHLLTSTPEKNLSQAFRYLLTEISRAVGRRTGRINHIFGGRYRWSVLWNSVDLAYVYKYVLRNPNRAGACRRVEEYEFSSFALLLKNQCALPIVEGVDPLWRHIPREAAARARWLNVPTRKEVEDIISLGLRRYEFALPTHTECAALTAELRETYGIEPVDNFEK